MQGRVDEVSGLCGGERHPDRFEVTHFADQDDVGVLPQHVLERVLERLGVLADLTLVHQAHLVTVQELDGVLTRHDVLFALTVRQVEERRQRGRLARTGRTGDEHEPAR